jgi:hypothetical protein
MDYRDLPVQQHWIVVDENGVRRDGHDFATESAAHRYIMFFGPHYYAVPEWSVRPTSLGLTEDDVIELARRQGHEL